MKFLSRLLSLLAVSTAAACAGGVDEISPAEAARRVAAGEAVLIDIREPNEWAETGVAQPAVLLPMSDFNGARQQWAPFLEKNQGKELILYCRTGNRSGQVAKKLAAEGKQVLNAGGFREWQSAGLPVRKP